MSVGQELPLLSTSTPLLDNASWTSIPFLIGTWTSLNVIVKSDVAGTLLAYWSNDGSVFDYAESYDVLAGVARSVPLTVLSSYVKLQYQNGFLPQTYFRLGTYGDSASSVISISQQEPINISIGLSGPNTVSLDQQQSPLFTTSLQPWIEWTSKQVTNPVTYNTYTSFASSYPESVIMKPTFVSDVTGTATGAYLQWKFSPQDGLVLSSGVSAPGGIPIPPTVWSYSTDHTPSSPTIACQFEATFLGLTGGSLPSLSYAHVGYGMPLLGTSNLQYGITISSTEPHQLTGSTQGWSRMCITTWNNTTQTQILQSAWDDPLLWLVPQQANNYRFVFTSQRILCQIRTNTPNGDSWYTFHTLPHPLEYYSMSRVCRMVVGIKKVSTSNVDNGIGLLNWSSYVMSDPIPLSYNASNRTTLLASTSPSMILALYNPVLWGTFRSDLMANMISLSMFNSDSSDHLFVDVITGGTINVPTYTTVGNSNIQQTFVGSVSGGNIAKSFVVPHGVSITMSLEDIRLYPEQSLAIVVTTHSSNITTTCSVAWKEYR